MLDQQMLPLVVGPDRDYTDPYLVSLARHRALQRLQARHREEFFDLLEAELQRPGKAVPRRSVVECVSCLVGHRHGHRCRTCGSTATDPSFPEDQCPRCEPRFT